MSPLALNLIVPQSMRPKYQFGLAVLPLGLMFASFLLTFQWAAWLATRLGIPEHDAVNGHPNGSTWLALFLGGMVALMVGGYVLGWLINAAIAAFLLKWPAQKIGSVFLRSELPNHWLKEGVQTPADIAKQATDAWERQRRAGALRFIAKRGVLGWGSPMFVVMYLAPTAIRHKSFGGGDFLFNIGLWAAAGACFGAIIWYVSEANYRKAKGRL